MPKASYREGDWFAVPLRDGGYAAGLIARANPKGVLLGYFFGNIPFIRQYLNVIVLVGIAAAIVPVALGALWKVMRRRTPAASARKTGGQ